MLLSVEPHILLNLKLLGYIFFILVSALVSAVTGYVTANKFKASKGKTAAAFLLLSFIFNALSFWLLGLTLNTLKAYLFFLIMLTASFSDIQSRRLEDYFSVMIMLVACINIRMSDLPFMFLSLVFTTLPMFLAAIFSKGNTVGGADIKLTAASAFLLGMWKGMFGLIIGMLISVIVNLVYSYRKNKSEGFPLIPYLAVGYLAAYFM